MRATIMSKAMTEARVQRLDGSRRSIRETLAELHDYRDLLYFLVWRDVQLRYKQTALGVAWAVLQPCLTMLIFSLFFGRLARMPSDGVPYPLFASAALVPWTFFVNTLNQSVSSVVGNANLVKKVYFPRLSIPLSTALSGGIDFALAFALLLVMMMWYGVGITPRILAVPALVALLGATTFGVGLWLSGLNVRFRDVRFAVPFVTQLWLFATPIAYPSSLLPAQWRPLFGLNPMAGVVEGFRWALLGTSAAPGFLIATSTLSAAVILLSGVVYFSRVERTFADVV
jgi:lipopolysaccharide transport system permease protein